MNYTSQHQIGVGCRFDSFCKKVIKNAAYNYLKEVSRFSKHETTYFELSTYIACLDDYEVESFLVHVCSYDVIVQDEKIAEALLKLPFKEQSPILLYYFIGFNDREIGKLLGVKRSTVNDHRRNALQKIKTSMEGYHG